MSYEIVRSVEAARGCGFRKAGGLYLVTDGLGQPCGKLPFRLEVCSVCSCGIKPARAWTWINATALFAETSCEIPDNCCTCPLANPGRCGLLWIGGSYYKTPSEFTQEAAERGVSRRIADIPNGFEVGVTLVLVAHREVFRNPDGTYTPGIFHGFVPQRIEYVVKPDDTPEKLQRMADRGITLVDVIPKREDGEQPLLEEDAGQEALQDAMDDAFDHQYGFNEW